MIVSMVIFITRIKWESTQHEKDITELKVDINNIGKKTLEQKLADSNEIKTLLVRIDAVDKATIAMQVDMNYVKETVKELKEKLFKSTAII
jgi:hypothetical protein